MGIDDSDDPGGAGSTEEDTTTQAGRSGATYPEGSDDRRSTDVSEPGHSSVESGNDSPKSIEDMLLEFDEQEGLIRDRSLLDLNFSGKGRQTHHVAAVNPSEMDARWANRMIDIGRWDPASESI